MVVVVVYTGSASSYWPVAMGAAVATYAGIFACGTGFLCLAICLGTGALCLGGLCFGSLCLGSLCLATGLRFGFATFL